MGTTVNVTFGKIDKGGDVVRRRPAASAPGTPSTTALPAGAAPAAHPPTPAPALPPAPAAQPAAAPGRPGPGILH